MTARGRLVTAAPLHLEGSRDGLLPTGAARGSDGAGRGLVGAGARFGAATTACRSTAGLRPAGRLAALPFFLLPLRLAHAGSDLFQCVLDGARGAPTLSVGRWRGASLGRLPRRWRRGLRPLSSLLAPCRLATWGSGTRRRRLTLLALLLPLRERRQDEEDDEEDDAEDGLEAQVNAYPSSCSAARPMLPRMLVSDLMFSRE